MFIPDGDLYTDGKGRTRHFRWQGIDENSQFGLFGNKELWGEEDGMAIELSTEEEIQRRKERYEREAFLREEMVLNGSFVSQCSVFRLVLCWPRLSNHDGNAKENVTLKMTSKYFKLLGDSFSSFNPCNVTEQSGSCLCKGGATVKVEKRKFTVVCSRST